MKINLDRYNEKVKNWASAALQDMETEGETLGIKHRKNSPSKGASLPKIRVSCIQSDGAIYIVAFKLRRTLVYPHKGAGKGYGGNKGGKWVDRHGNKKETDPRSLGGMGTGARKAKPFFDNVLNSDTGVDELAYIAAVETGDSLVSNLFIKTRWP